MTTPLILVEKTPTGVVTLALNRPQSLNAMTAELGDALIHQIQEVKNDPAVRAVVLTGVGKAFSAGGDLKMIEENGRRSIMDNRTYMKEFYKRYLTIRDIPVPTIAAFNGAAIGAGLCIGLACDIRIASDDAKLALNFVKLGLHPGMGATWSLPRLIGMQAASDLLFTGRTLTADEALRMGLVARVVPKDHILLEAMKMAEEIAHQAPVAVKLTKKALQQSEFCSLDQQLDFEAIQQSVTFSTEDFREGIKSVIEKRPAKFNGK